ncbi:MAG: hypothetical protein SFX72_01410 [Isosphaeraceae bacterium]|nr:hypothetical protein [Isosphaeraceae bacterium]
MIRLGLRLPGRLSFLVALALCQFGFSSSTLAGPVLNAPAGLGVGDRFRIVFVTEGSMSSSSSSIADYDAFVTAQADGATYEGRVVRWQVIGSTSTVNAIDHIGSAPISGVYLVNGTRITGSTTASGLWSGSLLSSINQSLNPGTERREAVFTGTGANGLADGALGSASVRSGSTARSDSLWVRDSLFPSSRALAFYGISEVLTVPDPSAVPEPGTFAAALLGLAVAVPAISRRRQKV